MQTIVTHSSLTKMLFDSNADRRAQIIGRALVALLKRQTQDERTANTTNVHNNRGFMSCDARSGSIGAKYFLKHGTLLDWQVEKWMKPTASGTPRIVKYSKQLNEVANEKLAAAA